MLQLRKTKNVFANFPQGFWRFPTKFQRLKKNSAVPSRGQGNFRGLEALTPRPRTSKCVLEDSTSGDYHAATIKTCTSRGVFRGGGHCPCSRLCHGTKQSSAKYTSKSRNQIIKEHAWGRELRYLEFLHHFNQLESRSEANFKFFSTC